MSGEYLLEAPREEVWRALNMVEVLSRCIPGCTKLTQESDQRLIMQITTRIGPLAANFGGVVTLSDVVPLESYRLTGEMNGGTAGFTKGGATVTLADADCGTSLRYEASAVTGGRIAQIGSRLVEAASAKLVAEFFNRFADEIGRSADSVDASSLNSNVVKSQRAEATRSTLGPQQRRIGAWAVAFIAAVAVLAYLAISRG